MEEKAVETEKAYTKQEVKEIVRKAIRQERELWVSMFRGLPDMDNETRQDWIGNPDLTSSQLTGFAVSPFVIKVDRSVKPDYPNWVVRDGAGNVQLLHPELECEGPAEFHIRTGLTQWLHNQQNVDNSTTGDIIYKRLKEKGMLESCLGLQDGLAIQTKGIAIFRKLPQDKSLPDWRKFWKYVPLWKSVVRNGDGKLLVPSLFDDGCQVYDNDSPVKLIWHRLDNLFCGRKPTLRFASN